MSFCYIALSALWIKVINSKSACDGLGYYGENIRDPYLLRLLHGLSWIYGSKLTWIIGYAQSLYFECAPSQFIDHPVLTSPRSRQQRYLCSIRRNSSSELDAQYRQLYRYRT